jgi:hypothetical protein
MAHAHFPRFPFHLSHEWLESHSQLTARLKTFGIALGAVTFTAIAAALVVRLEWTLNGPFEVSAVAGVIAGASWLPMDTPRHFSEPVHEQAKAVKVESLPARF